MFVLRKILFYLTAICTMIFPEKEAREKGFAVSPLIGNGRFYMDTRKAKTLIGPEDIYDDTNDNTNDDASYENITPQMKADRCSSVTGSPLFKIIHQIDSFDPNINHMNLKQNYSRLYERLFKTVNSTTDVFSNPLRKYKIFVDGVTLREKLFLCLGISRISKKVVYYFLSNDYLLNDPFCEYDDEDLSNGFFVFAVNKYGQISLEALAEEPACISDDKYSLRYENYSLMQSSENQSPNELSEEVVDGTICALTTDQKVRLCTLVLSSMYDGEFVFLPRPESINPSCRLKVTKFPGSNVSESVENNWMIGCVATRTGSNEPTVFYISPGYEKSSSYDHKDFFIRGPRNEITLLSNINCRVNITRRTKFLFDYYFPLTTPINERLEKKNRLLLGKGLATPPPRRPF